MSASETERGEGHQLRRYVTVQYIHILAFEYVSTSSSLFGLLLRQKEENNAHKISAKVCVMFLCLLMYLQALYEIYS